MKSIKNRILFYTLSLVIFLFYLNFSSFFVGKTFAIDMPSDPINPGPVTAPPDSLSKIYYQIDLEKTKMIATVDGLESFSSSMQQTLDKTQKELQRLYMLYIILQKSPSGITNVAMQLSGLQNQFQVESQPFDLISELNSYWKDSLSSLGQKKALPKKGNGTLGYLKDPLNKQKNNRVSDSMSEMSNQIDRIEHEIALYRKDVLETRESIDDIVKKTQSAVPVAWQKFYGKSLELTAPAPGQVLFLLDQWKNSIDTSITFFIPQTKHEWELCISNIIVALITTLTVAAMLHCAGRMLGHPWDDAVSIILFKSGLFLLIGIISTFALKDAYGAPYSLPFSIGSLFLIFGISLATSLIRKNFYPELCLRKSPLLILFLPAVIGSLILHLEMPYKLVNGVWLAVSLLLFITVFFIHKKNALQNTPSLEKCLLIFILLVGIAPIAFSIYGLGRLGVVVFFMIYICTAIIIVKKILEILCNNIADHSCNKQTNKLMRDIIYSMIVPFAWVVAACICIPWIRAVPGIEYMGKEFFTDTYTLGTIKLGLHKLFGLVVLWFAFRLFLAICHAGFEELPNKKSGFEAAALPTLKVFTTYAVWTLFIIISLEVAGIDLTSLQLIAGGLSVGIGFGMQTIFNNLISGLMLLFGRNIMVGDVIGINESTGIVREVNVRATTIETSGNSLIYIPNATIMAGDLINYSRSNRHVEKMFTVTLMNLEEKNKDSYEKKKKELSKNLLDIASQEKHVMTSPAPSIILEESSNSEIKETLRIIIDDRKYMEPTMHSIDNAIKEVLKEEQKDIVQI